MVPLLAEGWSHAPGGTHLKVVPCCWRATSARAGSRMPRPRASSLGVRAELARDRREEPLPFHAIDPNTWPHSRPRRQRGRADNKLTGPHRPALPARPEKSIGNRCAVPREVATSAAGTPATQSSSGPTLSMEPVSLFSRLRSRFSRGIENGKFTVASGSAIVPIAIGRRSQAPRPAGD